MAPGGDVWSTGPLNDKRARSQSATMPCCSVDAGANGGSDNPTEPEGLENSDALPWGEVRGGDFGNREMTGHGM